VTLLRRALGAAAATGAAAAGWGHFEAGWVRLRALECPVAGLPPELAALRIAHLSDLHLGVPSRGAGAVERAVEWAAARGPDLVCVTGDVLARPSAEGRLRALLREFGGPYVVLGNHDFADTRDPFSRRTELADLPGRLLLDDARTVELRGRRVQIAGVDPRSYARRRARPERHADENADLRILLCHFPRVLDRLPRGAFHLVLSGHLHAGQICVPLPGGRVSLAHPRARYAAGLYRRPGTTMHVSPGLGTTFLPFRVLARPEATELVLQEG
jgi:predicted MPP superfamily phosphohydrolase